MTTPIHIGGDGDGPRKAREHRGGVVIVRPRRGYSSILCDVNFFFFWIVMKSQKGCII